MVKLSILICHMPAQLWRLPLFSELRSNIQAQIEKVGADGEVEILFDDNVQDSIGTKRNRLLTRATGEYLCFVDDDDDLTTDCIGLLLQGIATGADCLSLRGVITDDGNNPRMFEHSIRHKAYETVSDTTGYALVKYLRYPNHLNCIKSSIAKQFRFPETNHGEDTDYATQIFKSGLLKTEYWIDEILYHYDYRSKK